MTDNIEPLTRLKPFGPCEGDSATCMFKDRCPMEGNLYVKGKDKKLRIRACKDAVSRGRSSRRGGLDKQRKVAKQINVPMTHSLRPGNEEHYGGRVRIEVKSGAQVQPLIRAFAKAEKQSLNEHRIGDNRPFLGAFVPTKAEDGLVYAFRVYSDAQLRQTVWELAVQLGVIDE